MKKLITAASLSLACVLPLGVALVAPQAAAEDEEKELKYDNVETRQRQSVGAKCAKALEGVQETLEAEQWAESVKQLKSVQNGKSCSANGYEESQVWNFLGYAYYSLDQFQNAINAYKQVVNNPESAPEMAIATRYTVAQLYYVVEDYRSGVKELEAWMKVAPIVGTDAKVLLAQGYYQIDDKTKALKWVNEAITEWEAKGNLPKEGWWSLQRVLHYEKGDYKTTAAILEKLVKHYPSNSYWRQLGGIYGELERDMDRLVATEVVYLNKGIEQERQLMALAYMYLSAEVPFRAASIIDKGIKDKVIEASAKNLEVLGTAWYQARELDKAMESLEAAGRKSDSGEINSRLAGIYLDQGLDAKAIQAARKAINRGGVRRIDLAHMTLGNAYINRHCYNDAIKAFKDASKDERSARFARQWIKYAEAEGSRRQKLREAGAEIAGCAKV